jgi:anti-anti-sigma factor
VEWMGHQAVVSLPEHIDVSNAGQIREELLSVFNRGAAVLIADMTATVSCDHAGADAVARAFQRAVVNGTQLRLVVTAPVVRQVLGIEGLDRLVSIYPSLEAAIAAGTPAADVPAQAHPRAQTDGKHPPGPSGTTAVAITPAVLWQLIDALGDGLALTAGDGQIVLVNRRLADMFGYQHIELIGRPVETLVPADLRAAHRGYRAGYERAPEARPMGNRTRLVGLRKDASTVPVEISLSPVPTATGHFTLAVIRDATEVRRREDLADLARAAVAEQTHRGQELLDRVVHSLFNVGLSLQAAIDLPSDVARERISEALGRLDDTIHEIRDHLFAVRDRGTPPPDPASPNGAK